MKRSAFLLFVSVLFIGAIVSAGCKQSATSTSSTSSSSSGSGGSGDAPPEKPAVGMQIATTQVTLTSGQEEYLCWTFTVPQDQPLALVGISQQVPKVGVHHYAVYTKAAPPTAADPWECSTMGADWGLVSGGGVGTPAVNFPAGTAMTLSAGQTIVFQLHLLNVTGKALDVPPAYVNLVGTNETNLQPVGLLIAGTLDISIPPQSTGVNATGSCTLTQPMAHIFDSFPHMHQLGKRITSSVTPAGASSPTMLTDQAWNFQDQGLYAVDGSAAVGDQISVTCTYDNPTSNAVQFGLSTKDEMCVDVLYYYPATSPSTYCGLM